MKKVITNGPMYEVMTNWWSFFTDALLFVAKYTLVQRPSITDSITYICRP
ncbi:MAG: hypothetical protein RL266_493 [Bacteroidota bacterium]|jgi:hypothetical protein